MINADFNATTPLGAASKLQIQKAMEVWGNPSSSHQIGRQALELLELSRQKVATAAGASPQEVVFTSGGSEANTFALLGSYFLYKTDFRLLTSKLEHSSVKDTVSLLQNLGVKVAFAPIKASGELDFSLFEQLLKEFRPQLVSLMTANNETGVVFPISQVAKLCHANGAILHTDAVQAFGKLDPATWKDADLISISAHKIFGPKGVGALVIRKNQKLAPTHYGGSQEIKRRGGTENMIGIAGFGGAASDLPSDDELKRILSLRDTFENRILECMEDVSIQGTSAPRIPNTTNIRFRGVASEVLLSALDLDGVCVSAGSACSSGSISPSHVLLEMGLSKTEARECLRFSWSRTTTLTDIDTVLRIVISHVNRIRSRHKAQEK